MGLLQETKAGKKADKGSIDKYSHSNMHACI